MYNKYLSLLNEDLEDEAVLASLEDYLINTDRNFIDLHNSLDKRNTVYKLLTEHSKTLNILPYIEDIIKFAEGNNDIYPTFYGLYEIEKGLIIGYDSSKARCNIEANDYDLETKVIKFNLKMFEGDLDIDVECRVDELNDVAVKQILDKLPSNYEEKIIAKALNLANNAGLKVNYNRSMAQVEKGLEDSLNMIIYQFARRLRRNKY